jgi:hypothetical protein
MLGVEGVIEYPHADPARVFAMLIDPEFQRQKCVATGATSYDVDIRTEGSHSVIVCRRTLPTDGLPDFVKPFVGGGLELIETIDWAPTDDDGTRTGAVHLAFKGQPLSMTGTLTMIATGGPATGTRATLEGRLTANIPFLGGKVEMACEPLVHKALLTEQQVGTRWLAEPA